MTEPIEPNVDPAGLRGPGDPEAAKVRQQPDPNAAEVHPPQPEAGHAGNIREEQMTHAAGTVPAAYVGPGDGDGDADAEGRPEDAVDAGTWDADV